MANSGRYYSIKCFSLIEFFGGLMKKLLCTALSMCFGFSLFAYDATAFLAPATGVKSYTKTDYTVASKFGEYFRTPNAKYLHKFNNYGQEVENSELTVDGKLVDKITYEYDSNGRITSQSGFDDSENILWKIVNTYDKNGLKVDESEYDAKGNLYSKSIYKYTGTNCTEEIFYNGNGALIWKNTYAYDDKGNCILMNSYYASGELESKKTYKYNDQNKVQEIVYFDDSEVVNKKELYRYDAKGALTEIATYSPDNVLYLRQFYKYDAKGNVTKITTYSIAKKFGTTVNELVGMSDFTYQY